ncbi:PEP-CTERM sorting domain-containing protein [Pontiella sulfatireligans]|uniref:Ice-binding protein C-terminal domain-containing protein n=1 Tax=Pontiella sulfatireligans TaxID=2750658 RepID=A0A6C2UT95_9BACT|nr:PEP-CTERM sorting domain-containing protein [Pontiella sulfatireligans]VGO22464.1 hypothetical protein SCARR_04547 [Pontiella sulfatireligans]
MKLKTIVLLGLLWAGAQVHAELLLAGTQTNAPNAGRVAVGEYGHGPDSPILQARPFSTGVTAYNLTSIFFGANLTLASGTGGLSVSVYDNNGTVPGSAVAGGMNLFSATSATIDQMLTAVSTITLNANSTYWFVASVDQSSGATRYWWDMTDSAVFDSDVSGTGMPLANANNALGWASYGGSSMQMSIYGTAVPEPGSLTLMGVGAGGAWLARRKRQRRLNGYQFEELEYHLSFVEEERAGAPFGGAQL